MNLSSLRSPGSDPRGPVVHELAPLRLPQGAAPVRLSVRVDEHGAWRARMRFTDPVSGRERETAEIFCGETEQALWQSVHGLREHHLRDLYRSLE